MKRSLFITIAVTVFTLIAAIYVSLRLSPFKIPEISLNVSYGVLIVSTILTIGLAIFQTFSLLASRTTKSEERALGVVPEIGSVPKSDPASEIDLVLRCKLASANALKEHIKEEVKALIKRVERAQDYNIYQPGLEISKDVVTDINEILRTASANPRAALLLLSAKIERQMGLRLQEAGLQEDTNYISFRQAIYRAMQAGLFPQDTISAFQEFFAVRNTIAHNAAFDVEEATILTLVSIGIELLKLIATKKRQDTELSTIDVDMEE